MNMSLPVALDNEEQLRAMDTVGMFAAMAGLPDQCALAFRELGGQARLPENKPISNIVVTGLGGSAIGGDLLRVYAAPRIDVPITVNRDYVLPKFVGPDTLVFAVSYSGNTEETLSAYAEARERGASVVALTTGGKLGALAQADGFPVVEVPGGISPRAATGYLFMPTLQVLHRLGLLPNVADEADEMIALLGEMRQKLEPATAEANNQAKQIARRLQGKIPVIWGAAGTTEVVAQRWKGQINENAKAPAYWNMLPELNHNEIVGLEVPAEILKKIHLIILRDNRDHPRVQKRIAITKEVVQDKIDGYTEVEALGQGTLAKLYSLIYIGDYTSVYLAALNGVDPGPVKVIDFLKNELLSR